MATAGELLVQKSGLAYATAEEHLEATTGNGTNVYVDSYSEDANISISTDEATISIATDEASLSLTSDESTISINSSDSTVSISDDDRTTCL